MVTANLSRPRACQSQREVIRQQLCQSPFAALRRLSFHLAEGVLVLHGRVPTFYTKQVALTLAAGIEGIESIVDEIEVGLL